MSELERLRDRVEELEEALGLTAEMPNGFLRAISKWHRSGPMSQKCLGLLLTRTFCDRAALYAVLYGARPECDQPDSRIIDVYILSVRRALADHGIKLHTVYGRGWYLDDADKYKLREMMARAKGSQIAVPIEQHEARA
jgi:hypothetical protein